MRASFQREIFCDHEGAGAASAAYWTRLTVIDPLVAALLFVRPRTGVWATVVVITTNVLHNITVTMRSTPDRSSVTDGLSDPRIPSQIGFLLYVLLTLRMALGHHHSGGSRASGRAG